MDIIDIMTIQQSEFSICATHLMAVSLHYPVTTTMHTSGSWCNRNTWTKFNVSIFKFDVLCLSADRQCWIPGTSTDKWLDKQPGTVMTSCVRSEKQYWRVLMLLSLRFLWIAENGHNTSMIRNTECRPMYIKEIEWISNVVSFEIQIPYREF